MRAFRDKCVLIPRPDLEGIISRGIADYSIRGVKALAYAEVIDVGPGSSIMNMDVPDLEYLDPPGTPNRRVKPSIVLINLADVAAEHVEARKNKRGEYIAQKLWIYPIKDLLASWRGPNELPKPLNNVVLTKSDKKAFMQAMYGKHARDIVMGSGTDKTGVTGDNTVNHALRYVYERVVDFGTGRKVGKVFSAVPSIIGELVVFPTVTSFDFRFEGDDYKLTPFHHMHGAIDEVA